MDTVKLTVDGVEVSVPKNATVLDAAHAAGIWVPTLCNDPDLEPYGGCRLCVVEIEKRRGLPTACNTAVAEGMVVHTETEAVRKVRRTVVELLMAEHKADCLLCDKDGRCALQRAAAFVGVRTHRYPQADRKLPIDDSNPFFTLDPNKCIFCAKCVRTCDEIVGVGAIDFMWRGYDSRVTAFASQPIVESTCVSCGECVVRCPVNALMPKAYAWPAREVKTVCPYCGVGCGIYLGVRADKAVGVRGDRESPVNRGRLCVKGRFGIVDFLNHPDRLTAPLIKKDGQFVQATWDEALDLVASRLSQYKGDQSAAVVSAKVPNEDNYAMQKLARVGMGTNNVDHCARL